jgi:predicted NAD/FAD-binding protein
MHRNGKNVTLFEAGDVCGGHALTVDSTAGPVDLGFQVRSATAARPTDAIPYPREDSD